MKKIWMILPAFTAVLCLAVTIGTAVSFAAPPVVEEVAVMETDFGAITIRFFDAEAPTHVQNFKTLARKGTYDGVLFHRIVPNFVIQTGDPATADPSTPREAYGSGGTGNSIPLEVNPRKHVRGAVGMARSNDPNSADSQFYIVLADTPHLDRGYTVFGEVISGMAVVDSIAAVKVDKRSVPLEPVRVKSVKVTMQELNKP